jgi:hypothetical protein
MNTTENKTRKAYLPMVLMNDGDLDYINQSELTGHYRDIAVYFMMAECLLDLGSRYIQAGLVWNERESLEPLLDVLKNRGYTDMVNIINNIEE